MTGTPQNLSGTTRRPGVTFIGHSSFLIQSAELNLLVDPVFARFLVLLRRARHPGVRSKTCRYRCSAIDARAHGSPESALPAQDHPAHYRKTGKGHPRRSFRLALKIW